MKKFSAPCCLALRRWARAGALEKVLIRILYDFTLLHTVAAMYSPEQVQWGIIGVGDVCEVKSGPALQV
jgi:hypothetical protein